MAALLQSYPQPSSSTITMLHTRSASASDILQSASTQNNKLAATPSRMQRNGFRAMNLADYCVQSSVTSIAPYAFTSTPELNAPAQSTANFLLSQPDLDFNATSPSPLTLQTKEAPCRIRNVSVSSKSSTAPTKGTVRNASATVSTTNPDSVSPSTSNQNLSPSSASPATKTTPGRYRRSHSQRTESGDETSSITTPFNFENTSLDSIGSFKEFTLQMPQLSDFTFKRPSSEGKNIKFGGNTALSENRENTSEISLKDAIPSQTKRRLSTSTSNRIEHQASHSSPRIPSVKPDSLHIRQGSDDSLKSARSSRSLTGSVARSNLQTMSRASVTSCLQASVIPLSTQDVLKPVEHTPRASSSHATNRKTQPSPLSQPTDTGGEKAATKGSFASTVNAALQQPSKQNYASEIQIDKESLATNQLSVAKEKNGKKSKTSRLRRALSFGSAAELRRSSAENRSANFPGDVAIARKSAFEDELDAEQTKIARQQEAGGIGSGIYSGQGNFFGGSTDNISISSTASSASVMIRKMGNGMKKSTRSLVGLFRPKSVIGVPAADSAVPLTSGAQVCMVTVEAERENLHNKPKTVSEDDANIGTLKIGKLSLGLENTSLSSDLLGMTCTDLLSSRKSMNGTEKERADVLAAAKKGILKRSGGSTNSHSTETLSVDYHIARLPSPQTLTGNESPNSTAPSTPNDESQGPPRATSVALGGEDYFMSALKYQECLKSHPGTPQSSTAKRNATFSPRIQFHDTWPSGEYDRRGEIATCNRLTPMLAQQIKEELNTFKMEMEVHETSKIYTHFF